MLRVLLQKLYVMIMNFRIYVIIHYWNTSIKSQNIFSKVVILSNEQICFSSTQVAEIKISIRINVCLEADCGENE